MESNAGVCVTSLCYWLAFETGECDGTAVAGRAWPVYPGHWQLTLTCLTLCLPAGLTWLWLLCLLGNRGRAMQLHVLPPRQPHSTTRGKWPLNSSAPSSLWWENSEMYVLPSLRECSPQDCVPAAYSGSRGDSDAFIGCLPFGLTTSPPHWCFPPSQVNHLPSNLCLRVCFWGWKWSLAVPNVFFFF